MVSAQPLSLLTAKIREKGSLAMVNLIVNMTSKRGKSLPQVGVRFILIFNWNSTRSLSRAIYVRCEGGYPASQSAPFGSE